MSKDEKERQIAALKERFPQDFESWLVFLNKQNQVVIQQDKTQIVLSANAARRVASALCYYADKAGV